MVTDNVMQHSVWYCVKFGLAHGAVALAVVIGVCAFIGSIFGIGTLLMRIRWMNDIVAMVLAISLTSTWVVSVIFALDCAGVLK